MGENLNTELHNVTCDIHLCYDEFMSKNFSYLVQCSCMRTSYSKFTVDFEEKDSVKSPKSNGNTIS